MARNINHVKKKWLINSTQQSLKPYFLCSYLICIMFDYYSLIVTYLNLSLFQQNLIYLHCVVDFLEMFSYNAIELKVLIEINFDKNLGVFIHFIMENMYP